MFITLEEKTASILELEMPAYFNWGPCYIKILDEKTAIKIKDFDFDFGITREDNMSASIASYVQKGTRITEEQFLEAFERVGEKVKRELIKAIETDGWKAQEQAELKAGALAEVETTQS